MPTKDAHQLDGSAPWLSLFKELEAHVPRSYSEKAKLLRMWWLSRTRVFAPKRWAEPCSDVGCVGCSLERCSCDGEVLVHVLSPGTWQLSICDQ